jgi:HicA-like toxin of HicAB toxin-antitoxin system
MAKKKSGVPKVKAEDAANPNTTIKLNSKNQKTLEAIFKNPVRSDIPWGDIERLLEGLGGIVDSKRSGSRVGVSLRGVRAVFHEPHPNPATNKGAVKNVREFLSRCGITV